MSSQTVTRELPFKCPKLRPVGETSKIGQIDKSQKAQSPKMRLIAANSQDPSLNPHDTKPSGASVNSNGNSVKPNDNSLEQNDVTVDHNDVKSNGDSANPNGASIIPNLQVPDKIGKLHAPFPPLILPEQFPRLAVNKPLPPITLDITTPVSELPLPPPKAAEIAVPSRKVRQNGARNFRAFHCHQNSRCQPPEISHCYGKRCSQNVLRKKVLSKSLFNWDTLKLLLHWNVSSWTLAD
uniref:Ovule protein n=1 Tax=Rhabditophanes sp. KR3021 TaxID=114890 RepID=A0AC35TM70_9BILA